MCPKKNNGLVFIISAPSGSGKTSLVKKLCQSNQQFKTAISHTTRQKRDEEREMLDYHFISVKKFQKMIRQNAFLEYAHVHENYYGTAAESVEKVRSSHHHVILEIDWQGALQIKQKIPHAFQILILPPNLETLKNRLFKRGSENHESIEVRLSNAKKEIKKCKHYDYLIINDEFEHAFDQLVCITNSCTHKLQNSENQILINQLTSAH